jgi:general secretion pathway protein D
MGDPRVLAQIESLLVTLDVRQPQVMLEVLIVSLSDSQTLDLGVDLETLMKSGDVRIRLASLFGLGIRSAGGDRTVGDGQGFTGLVLSPGDFSIVLRALQTINHGRSLSMPQLLAANNEQAVLDSVLTQPYASTNASNTVTTTSFGGAQDAGTQVTLKPQIAAGDHLNLEYSISLSAFVGAAASANLPPPRQQNKVQSAATIPDGYTVAVGGIELNTEGQGTSQIPGLGNIPIIGEAFKSRSRTQNRSRFFVFIRANVLRNQAFEDLKYLSDVAAVNAGVDDGFPEVEPQVIR